MGTRATLCWDMVDREGIIACDVPLIHPPWKPNPLYVCGIFISNDLDYTYSGSLKMIPASNRFKEVIHGLHNIFGFWCWTNERYIHMWSFPLFWYGGFKSQASTWQSFECISQTITMYHMHTCRGSKCMHVIHTGDRHTKTIRCWN